MPVKIEERTELFIAEVKRLKDEGVIQNNSELIDLIGVKNVSTITEIVKKRQNIQPDAWEKFKKHYRITENSVMPVFDTNEQITQAAIIKVLNDELAKIKSKVFNLDFDFVVDELKKNTSLIIKDIFREKGLKQ